MNPICPYLGLLDDPKTRKLFADHCHACHQAQPPRPLVLQQQREVCLTQAYQQCEGYTSAWEGGFPKQLVGKSCPKSSSPIKRRIFPILGTVMIALLVFLGLGYALSGLPPSGVATLEGNFQMPDRTNTPAAPTRDPDFVLPLSQTQSPSHTPTATLSPTPEVTPTITPGPALLTPFGREDFTFVVYQVQEGDTLSLIAQSFNTTVEIIQQLNVREVPALWAGEIFVICVDCQAPPDLPPLRAVYLEEETPLADLTAGCTACDPEQIRRWNDLDEGDLIPGERWVILPEN